MIRFLFWNIHKNDTLKLVSHAIRAYSIDVVILAECVLSSEEIDIHINSSIHNHKFKDTFIQCPKIKIYHNNRINFETIEDEARFTIQRVVIVNNNLNFLLIAAHLPSKLHFGSVDQSIECERLVRYIQKTEESEKHTRTIVVGDMNINPFEEGMVKTTSFHAVMSQNLAKTLERTVQGEIYRFFYNPMWSLFGDLSPGPPGTFYHKPSAHIEYFWNMYDQVLLRPAMLKYFCSNELKILTHIEDVSLVTEKGLPDAKFASDHLPLLFTLNTEGEKI
jgi:mRNA deadenylase 3'-5' endonuclease subunit Ccr4